MPFPIDPNRFADSQRPLTFSVHLRTLGCGAALVVRGFRASRGLLPDLPACPSASQYSVVIHDFTGLLSFAHAAGIPSQRITASRLRHSRGMPCLHSRHFHRIRGVTRGLIQALLGKQSHPPVTYDEFHVSLTLFTGKHAVPFKHLVMILSAEGTADCIYFLPNFPLFAYFIHQCFVQLTSSFY